MMTKVTDTEWDVCSVTLEETPLITLLSATESRVFTFLETYLASGHQKLLPTVPGGLGPIQKELEEVAVKFVRLVNYNKMVFCPYYDAILGKLLLRS